MDHIVQRGGRSVTAKVPKTEKGRATRDRIVAAASELIGERGVADTSLDDVIERAGASKSQLYHYFEDRSALRRSVVEHNADDLLGHLRDGLRSMQDQGKLHQSADADELATATMAAIHGGYLLTQARRDPGQLAIALDAAYGRLRAHAANASVWRVTTRVESGG